MTDQKTTEILFGGSAGGAKSWTGCVWLLFNCLLYPGSRWFIGREELKRLRESTLITFYKVCRKYGVEVDRDFKFNGQDFIIQFSNGSTINLLELKQLPSDPLFERLGSLEFTGGFIDESSEISFEAFDTLKSRVGRHMNNEYGLQRKIFCTCNPKRNHWLYQYFYKPAHNNGLAPYQAFLRSGVDDNVFIEQGYREALESITDPIKKSRLLSGSWDYNDSPAALCDYNAILSVFENTDVERGKKYISADLAMQGRDRFVGMVWDGMVCKVELDQEKSTGKSIERDLAQLMKNHSISNGQTVVDSDGLGNYLESYLRGIKQFRGGMSAHKKEEFANLKSECAYKLAEMINKRAIRIECNYEQKQRIIEELMTLMADDVDADEKRKRIIKKEKMKEMIQRSPDYLDALIMRMYFLVVPQLTWVCM